MLGSQGDRTGDGEQVSRPEVGELLEDRTLGCELSYRLRELAVEEQEQPAPDERGQGHDHEPGGGEAPYPQQQDGVHLRSSVDLVALDSCAPATGPSPSA